MHDVSSSHGAWIYLSFAKPQALNLVKLNISEDIKSVIGMMNSYALMRGILIQTDIADELYILGNEMTFKQVVLNLIKNAIEALPMGGNVGVEVQRDEQVAYITVRDDGEGIPPEQLDKLGEAFFTTKSTGTGLGLSVTKKILADLNGKIAY